MIVNSYNEKKNMEDNILRGVGFNQIVFLCNAICLKNLITIIFKKIHN
jgi:hypothetical protein